MRQREAHLLNGLQLKSIIDAGKTCADCKYKWLPKDQKNPLHCLKGHKIEDLIPCNVFKEVQK